MSDSVQPHRRQPTRLPHPWDSPGKNTGVGCNFLLQCMKVKSESEVAQSCPTLCNPMDCSLPGSSAHGIFQATILEWGAIAFSVLPHRKKIFALLSLPHHPVYVPHPISKRPTRPLSHSLCPGYKSGLRTLVQCQFSLELAHWSNSLPL